MPRHASDKNCISKKLTPAWEGPRLGSRAESFFLRDSAQCDLVGTTNVPEVFLAREAQMAYCLCLVTDYDCWMDDPAEHVSVDKFFATYQGTLEKPRAY